MKHANNPIYMHLLDQARERLVADNKFFWDDVIATLPKEFSKYAFPVEWGYIRETLEHELGGKLIPICRRTDGEWDPDLHPERFLPGAYHPTIGYAMPAEMQWASMVWADRRCKVAVGAMRSVEAMVATLQAAGLPVTYKPAVMPVLGLPAREAAE